MRVSRASRLLAAQPYWQHAVDVTTADTLRTPAGRCVAPHAPSSLLRPRAFRTSDPPVVFASRVPARSVPAAAAAAVSLAGAAAGAAVAGPVGAVVGSKSGALVVAAGAAAGALAADRASRRSAAAATAAASLPLEMRVLTRKAQTPGAEAEDALPLRRAPQALAPNALKRLS
jgi:hypothetical protein